MAARSTTIGESLVTWLNAMATRGWTLRDWTSEFSWNPIWDKQQWDDQDARLSVLVSMDSRTPDERLNRAGIQQRDYSGAIYFRNKYLETGEIPKDWFSERVQLVEQIADAMFGLTLTGQPTGYMVWIPEETTIDPLCDLILARDYRAFGGVIEFVAREVRP